MEKEYKIIDLAKEYEGFTGDTQYAIVTDLTEEELEARYGEELTNFRPFVILSGEMDNVINEHKSNEEKHKQRQRRSEILFDCTNDYDSIYRLLSVDDAITQTIKESERKRFLEFGRAALMSLTDTQRRYLVLHYYYGKSLSEIARVEGKSKTTVCKVCSSGRASFTRVFKKLEAAS